MAGSAFQVSEMMHQKGHRSNAHLPSAASRNGGFNLKHKGQKTAEKRGRGVALCGVNWVLISL